MGTIRFLSDTAQSPLPAILRSREESDADIARMAFVQDSQYHSLFGLCLFLTKFIINDVFHLKMSSIIDLVEICNTNPAYQGWVCWEEVRDPEVKTIIADERKRLGLFRQKIFVMKPEDSKNPGDYTSSAKHLSGDRWDDEVYEVRLHPQHTKTIEDTRHALRHEFAHIAFGDCDFLRSPKNWLSKLVKHLHYDLIEEPRAVRYAKEK